MLREDPEGVSRVPRARLAALLRQRDLPLPADEHFGVREEGTARLDQTVDAYRAALEVFRPAGASPYVGIAFHPACVLD